MADPKNNYVWVKIQEDETAGYVPAAPVHERTKQRFFADWQRRPVVKLPTLAPPASVHPTRLLPGQAQEIEEAWRYLVGPNAGFGSVSSWYDEFINTMSGAWSALKDRLSGGDETAAAQADINRVVGVLVGAAGMKQQLGDQFPESANRALQAHQAAVAQVLSGACAADGNFQVQLPDIVGDLGISCATVVPYDQWQAAVQTQPLDQSSGATNGLGAIPLLAVVVVAGVILVLGASTAYLLSSRGKADRALANSTADALSAITTGLNNGSITPDQASSLASQISSLAPCDWFCQAKRVGIVAGVGFGLYLAWPFLSRLVRR